MKGIWVLKIFNIQRTLRKMFQLPGLLSISHFCQWVSWIGCSAAPVFPSWDILEPLQSLESYPRQGPLGKGCHVESSLPPGYIKQGLQGYKWLKLGNPGVTCTETYSLSLLWSAYKYLQRQWASQRSHCNERDTAVELQGCEDFFPVAVIYVPGTGRCNVCWRVTAPPA